MNRNIANMRKMELKLLIIEYNKASLLDRSFAKTELSSTKKIEFRKKLLEYCIFLMEKIDNETLENSDIREKIRELTRIDVNNIVEAYIPSLTTYIIELIHHNIITPMRICVFYSFMPGKRVIWC